MERPAAVRARALHAGTRGLLIELYADGNLRACQTAFHLLLEMIFPLADHE